MDGLAGGGAEPAVVGALPLDVPAAVLAALLAGILSFCPTRILSLFKLLAARRVFTLTPNWPAIRNRESPDLTV